MEEKKVKLKIGNQEFIIQELTIEQSGDFLKFLLKSFRNIDLEKLQNPIELIEKAVDVASNNFTDFAHAIFKDQHPENVNWKKIKMSTGIMIINFFFKCNKESVEELQKLWQSSASKEAAAEMLDDLQSNASTVPK